MFDLVRRKIRRRPFPLNIPALRACRVSYSQHGEDLFLTLLLGYERSHGVYVDIGCFQPIVFSNTYIFYQRGWKGLAIDPNPQFRQAWRRYRPRDTFLNLAISKTRGRMTYLIDRQFSPMNKVLHGNEVTGFDPAQHEVSSCEAAPLAEVLSQHLEGNQIDLMSVDCEGMDLEVLESNDWNKYRPLVLAVEDMDISGESRLN
jgi:FkbM family methyltransferase